MTEKKASRLTDFENADDLDLAAILPSRPRVSAKAEPTPRPAQEQKPEPEPKAAGPAKDTSEENSLEAAVVPQERPAVARKPKARETQKSLLQVPAAVLEDFKAKRDREGLSNGQLVIAAIEQAHPRLRELIHPESTGGGVFAQRATRGVRKQDGPLTPLSVLLFKDDFAVMDQLVEEFGAHSRSHLVSVCLVDYFSK